MVEVYCHKTKTNNFEEIRDITKSLLEMIVDENDFKFDDVVPMKVHFGESGNTTFVPAIAYDGIIDYLQSLKINTSFIETNVLYRGQRMVKSQHVKLAIEHGFTRLPIIIADGEIGECYYEVELDMEYCKKFKLGIEFKKYNQFVVCSHFKGHPISGFGGAIKQLCMGFASRGGKMAQHSQSLPSVMESKCISCGLCVETCSVKAIKLCGKAYIDNRLCLGCAMCIAVCITGAIYHEWSNELFCEKMAEYALAAAKNKKNIYINFVVNITRECDCFSLKMHPLTENIGVFASFDPVALDTACLDAVQKQSNSQLFENGRKTLNYAEKIGLGKSKYVLIEVN